MSSETRLTIGLELEIMLAYVKDDKRDPHPEDPRQVSGSQFQDIETCAQHVADLLTASGIPSLSALNNPTFEKMPEHERVQYWITTKESITILHDDVGYNYYPLELNSAAYFYDKSAENAIDQVLSIMRKTYRIKVNNSTAIHCHVGNAYRGFDDETLRNLMATAYTYERQWQLMMTRRRILESGYATPFGCSELGDEIRSEHGTRLDFLNRILELDDNFHLLGYLDKETRPRIAFNIRGLKTPYESGRRTIEFRHHQGSFQPVEIRNWLKVCVKLVEMVCHIANDAEKVEKLIKQLREDCMRKVGHARGQVSTVQLLMWLGCPVQAYYYGRQIAKRGDEDVQNQLDIMEINDRTGKYRVGAVETRDEETERKIALLQSQGI